MRTPILFGLSLGLALAAGDAGAAKQRTSVRGQKVLGAERSKQNRTNVVAMNRLKSGKESLLGFLLEAGSAPPSAATHEELKAYLDELNPGSAHLEETTRFLLRAQAHEFYTSDRHENRNQIARAFFEEVLAHRSVVSAKSSLLHKQLLFAKAAALGKKFFVEGSYKQMKEPEIRHSELRDHAVTNTEIEGYEAQIAKLHIQAERFQELIVQLHSAMQE